MLTNLFKNVDKSPLLFTFGFDMIWASGIITLLRFNYVLFIYVDAKNAFNRFLGVDWNWSQLIVFDQNSEMEI
jgi:hypothetical protein